MSKIAVDTNILLYALDDFDPSKQIISMGILADRPIFCSQSLSEFTNVCIRRWKFPKSQVAELLKTYMSECLYIPITEHMLLRSFDIMKKYNFQLFDSMIVSAALESECSVLYSEDMQHELLVDKQLKILNPFI